jgi:hypothetical protein
MKTLQRLRSFARDGEPDPVVETLDAPPGDASRLGAEILSAGAAAALAVLAVTLSFRLWDAHFGIPFDYHGDATAVAMIIKAIQRHGWYLHNPDLNAPFGQHFHDIPLGAANLQLLMLKVLGLFTSNVPAILNLYYLATYPVVALAGFVFFRSVGVTRPTSTVCSALFALLPYHFARGESHLFLSAYYAVPLGAWLAYRMLAGQPLFGWSPGRRRLSVVTIGFCILIGTCETYYAAFTLLLVGGAAAIVWFQRPSWETFRRGLAVVVLILAVVVVNQIPSLWYWHRNGPNTQASYRDAMDSERYGLKFAQLVVPPTHHRLAAFRSVANKYQPHDISPGECCQSLGTVGTAGFLMSIGIAFVGIVGGRRRRSPDGAGPEERLAALTLLTFLVATLGGISALLGSYVTTNIRTWSRMSVVIALLSLAMVGLTVDRGWSRVAPRLAGRRRMGVGAVLLGALLLGGAFDQTSPAMTPNYEAIAAEYFQDRDFVRDVEARLPKRAMVFQFPVRDYPEAPGQHKLVDYDDLNPYQHSETVRWSHGGVKGRPDTDWQRALATQPLEAQLVGLALAGFAGVTVDGLAYPDSGAALKAQLSKLIGAAPLDGPGGRFAFFPLDPVARAARSALSPEAQQDVARGILHPVTMAVGEGFYPMESQGASRWFWARSEAALVVHNPDSHTIHVELVATVSTGTGAPSSLRIKYPDGTTETVTTTSGGTELRRVLVVPPGANAVHFATDAPRSPEINDRDVRFRLTDPKLTPDGLASAATHLFPVR